MQDLPPDLAISVNRYRALYLEAALLPSSEDGCLRVLLHVRKRLVEELVRDEQCSIIQNPERRNRDDVGRPVLCGRCEKCQFRGSQRFLDLVG